MQGKRLSAFGAFKQLFHVDPWLASIPFNLAAIFITGYGFYKFEGAVNPSFTFRNSMWHSVIVVTTVGFGDIYTESDWGRIHTIFTAVIGMMMAFFFLTSVLETLSSDLQQAENSKSLAKKKQKKILQLAAANVHKSPNIVLLLFKYCVCVCFQLIASAYIYSKAHRLHQAGLLGGEQVALMKKRVR